MIWQPLEPLPPALVNAERLEAHDVGGHLLLVGADPLHIFEPRRGVWSAAPSEPNLRFVAVDVQERVLAWVGERSRPRLASWRPGDASWTLGPVSPLPPLCAALSSPTQLLVIARQSQLGAGNRCLRCELDTGRWTTLPHLPRAGTRWRLDALHGGTMLARAPREGLAYLFERGSWHELRLEPGLLSASVVPWPRPQLLKVNRRELQAAKPELDPSGHVGRTLLPLPRGFERAQLHFVADLAVLSARGRLRLASSLALRQAFEQLERPVPRWEVLELPERVEPAPADFLSSVEPDEALRLVASRSSLLAYAGSEAWLASFGESRVESGAPSLGHPGGWRLLEQWLSARRDPRGDSLRAALGSTATADPFRAEAGVHAYTRRSTSLAEQALQGWSEREPGVELTREHGFVTAAKLRTHARARRGGPSFVALLAEAPSAAFLHRLHLDAPEPGGSLAHYLEEFARAPRLPPVRSLVLGPSEPPASFLRPSEGLQRWLGVMDARAPALHLGSLAGLERLAGGLRSLEITANDLGFVELNMPALERLCVRTQALSESSLGKLARCSLPALRSVELWFGPSVAGLSTLLDGLPAVRRLSLQMLASRKRGKSEAWLEIVLGHPLLAQLEHLDLSGNELGRKASKLLVARRPAFTELRSLVLLDNAFGPIAQQELRRAFGARLATTHAERE